MMMMMMIEFYFRSTDILKKRCPYQSAHRRAFCQFPFRWIYYYDSNKSTGKETGKTHLYEVYEFIYLYSKNLWNQYVTHVY